MMYFSRRDLIGRLCPNTMMLLSLFVCFHRRCRHIPCRRIHSRIAVIIYTRVVRPRYEAIIDNVTNNALARLTLVRTCDPFSFLLKFAVAFLSPSCYTSYCVSSFLLYYFCFAFFAFFLSRARAHNRGISSFGCWTRTPPSKRGRHLRGIQVGHAVAECRKWVPPSSNARAFHRSTLVCVPLGGGSIAVISINTNGPSRCSASTIDSPTTATNTACWAGSVCYFVLQKKKRCDDH